MLRMRMGGFFAKFGVQSISLFAKFFQGRLPNKVRLEKSEKILAEVSPRGKAVKPSQAGLKTRAND